MTPGELNAPGEGRLYAAGAQAALRSTDAEDSGHRCGRGGADAKCASNARRQDFLCASWLRRQGNPAGTVPPADRRGAESGSREPGPPQASRSPEPPPPATSAPALPCRLAPGTQPGSGRTQENTRSARPRTSSHTRLPANLVRGPSVPAARVRGRPRKANGPSHRSHPTDAVRYSSVDPATQRSTALQGGSISEC